MYEYLEGKLAEKTPATAVLETGGIGFLVHIPVSTYSRLPPLGASVKVLLHFLVREDAHILYGFLTAEERDLFRYLISVTGIGPKIAMTALSGIPIDDLKQAIVDGAVPVLTAISGIGRKTAERIIIELREKIVVEKRTAPGGAPGSAKGSDPLAEDCLQALVALGYRKQDAKAAVEKALNQAGPSGFSVEDLIRAALKVI